jgi:hypothetical protein
MFLSSEEHQKAQEWVTKHWKKGCPYCGSKQPQWLIHDRSVLPAEQQPRGGREGKGLTRLLLLPVVCMKCFAVSLLHDEVLLQGKQT